MNKIVCFGIAMISVYAASAMEPNGENMNQTLKVAQVSLQEMEKSHRKIAMAEAEKTWNLYKDTVFSEDNTNFDSFLGIVFMGKYHNDACLNAPLLEYRTQLARHFIDAAEQLFGTLEQEKRSLLAQKAFLVYIAARSVMPSLFDKSKDGIYLNGKYNEMLQAVYDSKLDADPTIKALKQKLEKQKSMVDYKKASQMSLAYSYAKRNCVLLADYIWRFFHENRVVSGCRPVR